PRCAGVRGAEQPAARHTHIEGARLTRYAGDRRHATAARWTDHPKPETVQKRGIDRRQQWCGRRRRRGWARLTMNGRERRDREQWKRGGNASTHDPTSGAWKGR